MKRSLIYIISVCMLLALGAFSALRANNIQIYNVKLLDKTDTTVWVRFDVGWDNSWKDRVHGNWDAAWVFCKAYDGTLHEWRHVYPIAPQGTPTNSGNASGCYIAQPHKILGGATDPVWSEFGTSKTEDGERISGLFIYRKLTGHGSLLIEDIRLKWRYVDDNFMPEDSIRVAVFAIEMVYIPAHAYIIGDGAAPQSLFYYSDTKTLAIRTNITGYRAANMNSIPTPNTETGFSFENTNGSVVPIPDEYPKGIKPYYIMKHEISQHAYVDFLNTLTAEQQAERTCLTYTQLTTATIVNSFAMVPPTACYNFNSNYPQYRNFIRVRKAAVKGDPFDPMNYPQPAVFGHNVTGCIQDNCWDMETNGGNIACNFLSWNDGLAYLDWSALRPVSEMEFEKACRGIKFLRGDMAWGEKYGQAIMKVNNKYFVDENIASEKAAYEEAVYIPTGVDPWVMRVGAFAKDSSNRVEAGATYYGVLNMSDNLYERCVNVSTEEGRKFIPQEGDGVLTQYGDADVTPDIFTPESCWPDEDGGGFRGGMVSDRTYAESIRVRTCEPTIQPRTQYSGFRGGRYAPSSPTATMYYLP